MKILIVEDEPALRELVQRSLEKERYVTEVAADFDSALEKIELYDYDCVLLDIMLPGGSGLDLLERLKELRKKENVIIISAKDSLDDKVLGLAIVDAVCRVSRLKVGYRLVEGMHQMEVYS